ncbi:hypothetical protein [Deinococcus sp. YIM 77859]|uniref:hypothetical protein n=1 Tax=Deinococcus sp. YIM 77859 TaxID=1540221 RepID=UPI00054F09F4|nr:hypothetical protein [Deinococcus sp. YIM 77859]
MSRRVVIRFRVEQPRPPPDAKTGKAKGAAPRIDADAMLAAIEAQLTPLVTAKWGGAEVHVVEARASEIRVEGPWPDKASVVRAWVADCLSEVLETFDPEPYLLQPS